MKTLWCRGLTVLAALALNCVQPFNLSFPSFRRPVTIPSEPNRTPIRGNTSRNGPFADQSFKVQQNPFFNPLGPQQSANPQRGNNHHSRHGRGHGHGGQQHDHSNPFVFNEAVNSAANKRMELENQQRPRPFFNPALPSPKSASSSSNKNDASKDCPNGLRVRKEFRDMTWEEWSRYKTALKKMYEPDSTGRSRVDRFTTIHLDNAPIAHNTAHFLPWHRWFTWLYEEELRKIDPQVVLPYWDWTFDAQDPLRSPIFRPEYLGMKTGKAGDCAWIVSHPRRHCVVRNYHSRSFGSFYGRRTVDRLITDDRMSWAEFAEMFESSPHGIVHFKVGGEGGDMADMASPNDPLFFLHHAMVDYVWVQRQEFTGRKSAFGGRHRGRRAAAGDVLVPFRITVQDTFEWERLCYTYQPFSGWLTAAPAALHAGANLVDGSAAVDEHRLPDPLPDSWIAMHGWTREWVSRIERQLLELEATPLEVDLQKNSKSLKDLHSGSAGGHRVAPLLIMIGAGLGMGVAMSFLW